MDIRKLQRAIVDGLEDIKGQEIVVFNTEHLSSLFERVIIASGTSNRQTKALAAGVRAAVRAAGFPVLATEGGDNGEWIIVDCGAAVAHIFQPAIRDYYRLEEIWGGKPVKMKLGERSTGLVKASEPEDDEDDVAMAPNRKAAAKKLPTKLPAKRAPIKSIAGPVVAKKVAKKVALSAAARSTSDRPAAKKALAAEVAARQEAARKTAARKTAATKTAATKTAAGKTTAARSTTARTAAAKPAAARKLSPRMAAAQPVEAVWDNNPGKTAPRKKAAPLGPVTKTLVVKPLARKTAVAKPAAPAARRKPAAVAGKTAGAARKTPARRS
jgi:ribosome-associated protein